MAGTVRVRPGLAGQILGRAVGAQRGAERREATRDPLPRARLRDAGLLGDLPVAGADEHVRADGDALLGRELTEHREADAVAEQARDARVVASGLACVVDQDVAHALCARGASPVVDEPPCGDGVEPGLGGGAAGLEPPAGEERGRERLAGQVGRQLRVAGPPREVALDAGGVAGIEGAERLRIGRDEQPVIGGWAHGGASLSRWPWSLGTSADVPICDRSRAASQPSGPSEVAGDTNLVAELGDT